VNSRLIHNLTRLLEQALIVLSVLISAVVFLQVVFRYVLQQPLFWSEELPRYLLIWMSFLAAAREQKDEAHINIGLCLTPLPVAAQRWIRLFTNLVILAFLAILVYSGTLVINITAYHRSTALQIPMAAVYAALPVGAMLMMLYLVLQIAQDVKILGGKNS
jgi:TRAP-type transport system small permease protein